MKMKIRIKSVSRTNPGSKGKTNRIDSDDYEITCIGNLIIRRSKKPCIDGNTLHTFNDITRIDELRKMLAVYEQEQRRLSKQRSFLSWK
jgi:hypothetical protein